MSTMTKVFVVLTAVFSIVLSVMFIASAAQWANWKKLAETFQASRDAEVANRQSTVASSAASLALKEQELAAKQAQLAEAQKTIQTLSSEIASLKGELTTVKNERVAFDADRKKLQDVLDINAGQLRDVQKEAAALRAQNIDLQSRNGKLNARVLDLTTEVTILTDEARNIQEKLLACEKKSAEVARAGGARAVSADSTGAVSARPTVAGAIRGQIMDVTGNYAGIDVGESSGVVAGLTMLVYRGSTYLGELVVDKVRPKEAGGRIVSQAKEEIRKGDLVWYVPEN